MRKNKDIIERVINKYFKFFGIKSKYSGAAILNLYLSTRRDIMPAIIIKAKTISINKNTNIYNLTPFWKYYTISWKS